VPSRDSAASEVPNYRSSFAAAVQIAARNNADNLPPSEEKPHLYFAKFDFNAREHGELAFSAGDRIIVVDANDDVWWMGYKDNGKGLLRLCCCCYSSYDANSGLNLCCRIWGTKAGSVSFKLC
jgi:hypothetical protein